MATKRAGELYVPIDDREKASIRALILARTSDPSGNASDVESQVVQCEKFIRQMGWTLLHPDDLYRYTETKTGMRQVRRPVLDTVLAMSQRREVDVIVCLAPARIDRKRARRYQAIQTALDYGVEVRFVRYADDEGRYPGGMAGLLDDMKDDITDENEAKNIKERMNPQKWARYEQGLPHGGKNGPNYGYLEGERRYKTGPQGRQTRPLGVLTWVEDSERAPWVRWLYQRADDLPVGELSLRHLAHELDTLGAPTPLSKVGWSRTAVYRILTNGKYAGKGANLKTKVVWKPEIEDGTNRVYDVARVVKRGEDEPTFPIPASAVPPLVTPEQFDRVQAKLAQLSAHHRSVPRLVDSYVPLFGKGLTVCKHCGSWMARWRTRNSQTLYYRCNRPSTIPNHDCAPHVIPAKALDDFVLRKVALALVTPERILALADAADAQQADAETEAALADTALQVATARLDALVGERASAEKALASLSALGGMESALADVRARLDALDRERAELLAIKAQGGPRRDRAHERRDFLARIFAMRESLMTFDFTPGATGEPRADGAYGKPIEKLPPELSLKGAASLLGISEADVRLPKRVYFPPEDEDGNPVDENIETEVAVETVAVVETMLRGLGRERLWRLLADDLRLKIRVSRPRPRSEWATRGKTTVAERVQIRLLDTVELWDDSTIVSR